MCSSDLGAPAKFSYKHDVLNPDSEMYDVFHEFRSECSSGVLREVLDYCVAFDGLVANTGTHAAAVIVSSEPIVESVPVRFDVENDAWLTGFDYPQDESLGLVKIDFLGLKNIDLIHKTLDNIRRMGLPVPDVASLPEGAMDDKATYDMLSRGDTYGVFQLSSPGMQELLKRMKPKNIHDISASLALYRPGPMGVEAHIKYADRASGAESWDYPIHPDFKGTALEDILEPTYGVIVYQEQVMQIASLIGGMDSHKTDKFRKAVSKKKLDMIEQLKPEFYGYALSHGYTQESLDVLWDAVELFSEYAFNASHSYAYAMIAYQTAYLKAHYGSAFFASWLDMKRDSKADVRYTLEACRERGYEIRLPDFMSSLSDNLPDERGITLGLSSVRDVPAGVGDNLHELLRGRSVNSLEDCVQALRDAGLSKRDGFYYLVDAGVFDSFGWSRAGIRSVLGSVLAQKRKTKDTSLSLFDVLGVDTGQSAGVEIPRDVPESFLSRVTAEANALSGFITGHPCDKLPKYFSTVTCKGLASVEPGQYRVTASLSEITRAISNSGSVFYRVALDDSTAEFPVSLNRPVRDAFEKAHARAMIRQAWDKYVDKGKVYQVPRDVLNRACSGAWDVRLPQQFESYVFYVTVKNSYQGRRSVVIDDFEPLVLDNEGNPVMRIRVNRDTPGLMRAVLDNLKGLAGVSPGETAVFGCSFTSGDMLVESSAIFEDMARIMGSGLPVSDLEESFVPMSWSDFERSMIYKDTGTRVMLCSEVSAHINQVLGLESFDPGLRLVR